ncbi:Aminotransferase-like, plant mobile domain [Sesbania bispinosa]|nr:Aminotransferase-like, plant mobile domain [Sesbania bispinosa]
MVKSRPVRSDPVSEDLSSSFESFTDLIPRSISFVAWTQLPPPGANPLDATSKKWMTDHQPATRPFCSPPSSGNDFFRDSLVTPSVQREEALLFHEVPNTSTHTVGPSLLRSRLICGEFPWVPCTFVDIMRHIGITDARWSHTTHTFFAAWGEFTPTLEDVHVLLKLPLFGDYDISTSPVDIARGTGNVLPPDQRKVSRESFKYTFATWIQYFFGDIDKGTFYPSPLLSRPLKRAAFLAFWLTKYVFPGPPCESVSPSVFIMACLLAEGVRLPLASLFVGSFYRRLDQIQGQLFISFGRFPINSFVDLVFLQYFLFERFPEYAPIRIVPEPPPEEDEFMTRNIRSSRSEGVYDTWALILHPQMLPGFIITDTVSTAGGTFWPFSYRPDRVCRQFGLDQPPCCISISFQDVHEAMKVVLFKPNAFLPPFDANKFIPLNRVGRVLDTWVAYYARLKNSVKCYEGHDSMQHFTNVQVMCKDPYFATTTFKSLSKQVPAQEQPNAKGKKYKLPTSQRGKKAASVSCEDAPSLPKKVVRTCKSARSDLASDNPSSAAKKQSSTRSAKVKNEILLPTRASERLKAHRIKKFYPYSSFSSPVVIQASTTEELAYGDDEVVQESPTSPIHESASPTLSVGKAVTNERVGPTTSDHASTPTNNIVKTPQELDCKAQSQTHPVTVEADARDP